MELNSVHEEVNIWQHNKRIRIDNSTIGDNNKFLLRDNSLSQMNTAFIQNSPPQIRDPNLKQDFTEPILQTKVSK